MKKNVMFIIGQLRNGGAERVICNLCNDLSKDYNITLCVRTLEDADEIYIPNVKIIEVNELSKRITKIFGIIKIHNLKKKLKIDTTISFHLKYNIYNYLSKYKDKVIVSIRNYEGEKIKTYTKFQIFLYKRILQKVDLIVNVSKRVRENQISIYKTKKEKNIVIPNYIDLEKINRLKKEAIKNQLIDKNTILTVGRLAYQKGIWHLIKAMKQVIRYNSNIKLVIIGRGPLRDGFKKLIKDLDLNNNVFLLDFNDNIYKYMYNAKVFVLTSLFEGMPNVLLESLACSLPIIATDSLGGTNEILRKKYQISSVKNISFEDYGILIPNFSSGLNLDKTISKEEELLASSIIELFENDKLYNKYKDNCLERVNYFKKEKILSMWKKII